MLSKETRHKVIVLFYMKFQNRQKQIYGGSNHKSGGEENVTGKDQEECDRNIYLDPYLLHNICENKSQMN